MVEHWLIVFFLVSKVVTINFPPLNLYIGTGGVGYGVGNLPLGAQSPFGALRLGPDTSDTLDIPIIFEHCGGYHYSDNYINVFSHTHMVGAGLQDYGEVGIFPIQVENDEHLQHMIADRYNYRSVFTHERERAEPGFYQVYLDSHKVNAELTATEQVGVHRYSFDKFNKRHRVILIDSSYTLHTKACNQTSINIDSSKNEITGSILFKGPFSKLDGGITTYFIITFTNWTSFGVWKDGHLAQGQTMTDGCSSGVYVILPDEQQQVTVYVGISFVSIEQAHTNLQMQTKLQSFDSIRQLVQQKWLDEISRFEVCLASQGQKITNNIKRKL
jgi:putative alpha-1,2-mannosidase